ncbi:hypothetical protein [Radiobacillus sp. PE A8.2]
MSKKDNISYRKSYESDGEMGKDTKKGKSEEVKQKKNDPMFFNITESSE